MHKPAYCMSTLFAQLGLDDSDEGIERFITENAPIPEHLSLYLAPCWNRSQASLLQEAIANDADWAEVVDQLNTRLRK